MKRLKYYYLYYGVLLLAMLYTFAFQTFISMPIRLAYLVAIVLPVIFNDRSMLPAVIALFYIPADASTGYTMLPTQEYFYAAIALVTLTIGKAGSSGRQNVPTFFVVFFALVTFRDLFAGGMTHLTYSMVAFIPLLMCVGDDCDKLLKVFPWSYIIGSVVASIGLIINPETFIQAYDSTSGFDRLTFTGMNYVAMSIGIGSFLSVVEFLNSEGEKWKMLVAAGSLSVTLIVLLLMGCRGAVVNVVGASAIYLLLSDVKKKFKFLAIIAATAIVIFLSMSHAFDLLVYRFQNDLGEGGGSNRLIIWQEKIEAFLSHPMGWMFGNGFQGMFEMGHKVASHNDFIAMLLSYGVVGLGLFIKMLVAPFKNGGNRKLVVSSLIYYLLGCMTLEPFTDGTFAFFLFYLYVLLLSRRNVA